MDLIQIIEKIYKYSEKPYLKQRLLKDDKNYKKFYVSLDTIRDTNIAISNYLELNDDDFIQNKYLFLYGVLQALFLQQDAIKHFSESLSNEKLLNNEKLNKIREIRNISIGHPTNKSNGKSFHLIIRNSISKNQFDIINYFPNEESKTETIYIIEIIKEQYKLLYEIMENLKSKIEKEITEHKSKFKVKMEELLPEQIFSNSIPNLNLEKRIIPEIAFIEKIFNNIKIYLKNRLGNLNTIDDIEINTKRIEFIINRLKFNDLENIEKELLIDNLMNEFKRLKENLINLIEE